MSTISFVESRDLIKNILVEDVTKRLTIPQILCHLWFTSKQLTYEPEPVSVPFPTTSKRPSTPEAQSRRNSESTAPDSSEASTQESPSPFIKQPELISSVPTTPEDSIADPFESTDNESSNKPSIQRHSSNSTIRRTSGSDIESLSSKLAKTSDRQPATVIEEDGDGVKCHYPSSLLRSSSSKGPPLPVRTPARTKRRSVSSVMSETGSPILDKTPTPLLAPSSRDIDFVSLLTASTPVMFSTPDERRLLNTLASLGFDTAQIVHSVLSYACDSAGALWWMLRKKEERTLLEDITHTALDVPVSLDPTISETEPRPNDESRESKQKKKKKKNAGIQTDAQVQKEMLVAPQFAFVPPTPTSSARPTTPPHKNGTPVWSPLLSPTSSSTCGGDSSSKSHPSTPSGSLRERDKELGSKGRKARAGSVSIMQRATTALEAAGLVRKRSAEAVRDEKEKDKHRENDRRMASGEEPRLSHSSASSKLTKTPPLKPAREFFPPSTPPPNESRHNAAQIGSPWVLADGREFVSTSAIAAVNAKGEMLQSLSTPNISETAPKPVPPTRNKSNLLAAFRLWFNEERKGKRKEEIGNIGGQPVSARLPSRRNSSSGKFAGSRGRHRAQRPSISSRRSSSVNSRRSSVQSAHMVLVESPLQTRKPLGNHTPNSEPPGEHSSRPSSIRSVSMQQAHRKSPSQSSAGSIHLRASSPMQKFHRRAGSGSSTRVVRQIVPTSRTLHARSNSATSSLYSPPSSRPTSFYEPSETEGSGNLNSRTASPYRSRRRSTDDSISGSRRSGPVVASTFVAQKRQGAFSSPAHGHTIGRSSWKKSWGIEPPGWSSRTAHLPIEVIDILPSNEPISIRDVFSGKANAVAGDDSDWVDEDDDIPSLAGGLGQMGTSLSMSSTSSSQHLLQVEPQPITLSPAPRGQRSKRNNNRVSSGSGGRSKPGHSPAPKSSPLPAETVYDSTETRSGRRQLPAGRSGPAFRHAIQEEDEGEEE